MIRFQWLMAIFRYPVDFCDVIWNALYEYLYSLFLGSIDARTWRGYTLYGPQPPDGPYWQFQSGDGVARDRNFAVLVLACVSSFLALVVLFLKDRPWLFAAGGGQWRAIINLVKRNRLRKKGRLEDVNKLAEKINLCIHNIYNVIILIIY